jgi:hypothetical protein
MAESGLLPFARVAREVAEAALPRNRSPFSKHIFPQPTLLAVRCLMRYEEWTYREAEVRLQERHERREALGIERVPDDTTLYRCLRRTGEDELTRLLRETTRRMPPPATAGTVVAVEGTGLAPGAISTFFLNRVRDRGATGSPGSSSWICPDVSSSRKLLSQDRPMMAPPCARYWTRRGASSPSGVCWLTRSLTANSITPSSASPVAP